MIITWAGKENFIIKTKGQTIKVGAEIALGTFKIQSPGEYESSGVQVEVIDGTIEILSEKMTIAWIKKAKILSDQELEKLNGIDVLLLGVGGGEFTDTKTAIGVVNQIEPKVVIPMYSGNPPAGSPRFGEAGEAGSKIIFSGGVIADLTGSSVSADFLTEGVRSEIPVGTAEIFEG